MDKINPIFAIERMKKILRYLGETTYTFEIQDHGIKKIEDRDHVEFEWDLKHPHDLFIFAHDISPHNGNIENRFQLKIGLTGKPLQELYDLLNEKAFEKAKKEFMNDAILNYLESKLKNI